MGRLRLAVLIALTVVACPVVLVVGAASPGFACSCASQRTADHVALADLVFIGTLVDIGEPTRGAVVSSSDPVAHTVAVEAVHRGDVGEVVVVESASSGASCGLEGLVLDRRYVVFADAEEGRLTATSCGGTAAASPRLVRALERLTGPPSAPGRSPVAPGVVRTGGDPSPGSGRADTLVWSAGGAVVLAAAGALALRRRRRRT